MLRSRSTPPELKIDLSEPSLLLPDNAQFALNAFTVTFTGTEFAASRLDGIAPADEADREQQGIYEEMAKK